MAINFLQWDFNKTPYDNMATNMILHNGRYTKKTAQFKKAFNGIKDGVNVGRVDIANWIHSKFGNKKPLCLWDKLIREIGRIGEQIGHELERFGESVVSELERFGGRAEEEVSRIYDDAESFVSDTVGSLGDAGTKVWDTLTGGCFITTATLLSFGNMDDNCYELTLIRKYRDTYLRNRKDGECIIKKYYELAPKIVLKIGNNPHVYKVIWDMYLEPFCCAIENDENEKALVVYLTMVEVLRVKYEL
jgi:hypothetical protein